MNRPLPRLLFSLLALAAVLAPAVASAQPIALADLEDTVRVRRDANNIPHIFAQNDHDALFLMGWVHAEDRLFQMDVLRRNFSGTLGELVGEAALPSDIQLRTLGLRRAAEETAAALAPETMAWVEAYTEGVNAYLAHAEGLPPEYGVLELTQVAPWTALDSLTIAKGIALGLSFDLSDLDYTEALLTFQGVGAVAGFDGAALFFEDLYRTAPFDPALTVPDFIQSAALAPAADLPIARDLPSYLNAKTLGLIRKIRGAAEKAPLLKAAIEARDTDRGSNWWIASGALTESGFPMLANDPHLALDTPSTFYEAHLRVGMGDGKPFNVSGISFPGAPGVIQGCNPWICWGSTVHPLDTTDVYVERIVFDPVTFLPTATIFDGQPEPLVLIPQTFLVNVLGDETPDNLVDAGIGPLEGGLTLVVPRRNNGPIVAIDISDLSNITGISVQYSGWRATHELTAVRKWARARDLDDFVEGLHYFDVGSQNWAYADRDGNIACFSVAEMPIREDLQTLNAPDGGIPPIFLRDGTHTLRHEWMSVQNPQPMQALDYEILPFAEMPQDVNPERGYLLNANNDPVGTSLDNNAFNQVRPGGGLYYLSPGYASGFRMGRLQRLFDDALASGDPLTVQDFQGFQANNQLLDAEVLVPSILAAFDNAGADGAAPELVALAGDAGVAEAIGRLAAWDFSTPTGIPEGYDPGDDPLDLPMPSQAEIDAAVAATLYSTWRGQIVQSMIDGPLTPFGLDDLAPGSALSMTALRNLLDSFDVRQGFGASGIDFLALAGVADREAARDVLLLGALRSALDALASDDFAAAFGHSTDQDDYRWGMLHRIVFEHPLGGPFDVPGDRVTANLGPDLPGVARAGGFGALDASSHSARADGSNDFMFGSGPARRFVGVLTPDGPEAYQVIPGGESGVIGDPFQEDQLLLWLTNSYHPFLYRPLDVIGATQSFQRYVPLP